MSHMDPEDKNEEETPEEDREPTAEELKAEEEAE